MLLYVPQLSRRACVYYLCPTKNKLQAARRQQLEARGGIIGWMICLTPLPPCPQDPPSEESGGVKRREEGRKEERHTKKTGEIRACVASSSGARSACMRAFAAYEKKSRRASMKYQHKSWFKLSSIHGTPTGVFVTLSKVSRMPPRPPGGAATYDTANDRDESRSNKAKAPRPCAKTNVHHVWHAHGGVYFVYYVLLYLISDEELVSQVGRVDEGCPVHLGRVNTGFLHRVLCRQGGQ